MVEIHCGKQVRRDKQPKTNGSNDAKMSANQRSGKADMAVAQNGSEPISAHVQARILAEALPHLIRYDEQTVVIKFGGHAMGDQALADAFAQDVVYLKLSGINPVVVHGGGPQIGNMLKKLQIKSEFVQG